MRLSLSTLVTLLCVGACTGPTSDWPRGNSDRGDDGAPRDPGKGTQKPSIPATDNTGTKPINAGGSGPASSADAGSAAHSPSSTGGSPASHDAGGVIDVPHQSGDGGDEVDAGKPDADAGAPDADASHAGPSDAGDAGTPGSVDRTARGSDAGASQCSADSAPGDAGSCHGVYCATRVDELSANVSQAGSCHDSQDLALVCSGELTRVVSACAQSDSLTLGFGTTVADCAGSAPSLSNASDACIQCYVGETLCAVQSCLTPCLQGRSPECTSCRSKRCASAFELCSGLPSP